MHASHDRLNLVFGAHDLVLLVALGLQDCICIQVEYGILKPLGRRLYRRGPLSPLQGDTARTLDIEAQTIQPWFNSS